MLSKNHTLSMITTAYKRYPEGNRIIIHKEAHIIRLFLQGKVELSTYPTLPTITTNYI